LDAHKSALEFICVCVVCVRACVRTWVCARARLYACLLIAECFVTAVSSFYTPCDTLIFLALQWQNTLSRQMLQSIAQLHVLSVILLHQKHMTKAGVAIATTEIIQFSEIQFFYMILSSISGSCRTRTNKTSTSMHLQFNCVQKQMKHVKK